MKDYLVGYKLTVGEKVFNLFGLIRGESFSNAETFFFESAPIVTGEGFTVVKDKVYGEFNSTTYQYLENIGGGLNLAASYKSVSDVVGAAAVPSNEGVGLNTETPTSN